jgi:RNA polymerase sigma-70 factor, ECF subfamily
MSTGRTISNWFASYSNDVNNFLVYYTGMRDVEDLVQEVFIKAIKGLDRFKGDAEPKTWLFSIARNVAKDEFRKRKAKMSKDTQLVDAIFEINDEDTPESIAQSNEIKKELYKAIQSLKDNYREVLILRGIEQLSIKETAVILNWSEGKVRTTYHRALKVLKSEGGLLHE